jgi:hypothetical protein
VVFVSDNWVEAEMVACALEGHEISSFIFDDNFCRIYPQAAPVAGGVKVVVPLEDLEDAIDVLKLAYAEGPPFIGGTLTVPLSLLAAIAAWLLGGRKKKAAEESSAAAGAQLQ